MNVSIGGTDFLVNVDTGSSNLAIPSQSCKACPSTLDSISAQCKQGFYNMSCACSRSSLSINNLLSSSSGMLVSCSSSLGEICVKRDQRGNLTGMAFVNSSNAVPWCSCQTVASAGFSLPVSSSYHDAVAVSGVTYGDFSGFFGPILVAPVTIGAVGWSSAAQANASFIAMTYKTEDFTCSSQSSSMADGIIGFAYGSISSTGMPTFFETLVTENKVQNIFSICLAYTPLLALGAVPVDKAGQLVLGGIGPSQLMAGPLQYTSLVQGTGFYTVFLTDILLGGVSLGESLYGNAIQGFSYTATALMSFNQANGGAGTIIDSGTTALSVPGDIFALLESSKVTDSEDLTFLFGGQACANITLVQKQGLNSSAALAFSGHFTGTDLFVMGADTINDAGLFYFLYVSNLALALGAVPGSPATGMPTSAPFSFTSTSGPPSSTSAIPPSVFPPSSAMPPSGSPLIPSSPAWVAVAASFSPTGNAYCGPSVPICPYGVLAYIAVPPNTTLMEVSTLPLTDWQGNFNVTIQPTSCAALGTSSIEVSIPISYFLNGTAGIEPGNSGIIIGQPIFQANHIVFDRLNGRLGFAKQGDCNFGLTTPEAPTAAYSTHTSPATASTTSFAPKPSTVQSTISTSATPPLTTTATRTVTTNQPATSQVTHRVFPTTPSPLAPSSTSSSTEHSNSSMTAIAIAIPIIAGLAFLGAFLAHVIWQRRTARLSPLGERLVESAGSAVEMEFITT